ncbi:hypothetical protein DJ71_10840, partial [Halorubrum sp. E3]
NTVDISDLNISGETLTSGVYDGSVSGTSDVTVTDVSYNLPTVSENSSALQDNIRASYDGVQVNASTDNSSDGSGYAQINITNTDNDETEIFTAGDDFNKGSEFTADISALDISEGDTLETRTENSDGSLVNSGNNQTVQEGLDVASVENLRPGQFAVGSDGNFNSDPVLDDQNQYTILLNPSSGAFADESTFGEGDEATLDLVSPAGATT